ncbi:uncharacterized protein TNCV_1444381 [Trichonephila clavipes]|nr:uncharacterized protein TNCV_1444381 [Trichonephila clavipes]
MRMRNIPSDGRRGGRYFEKVSLNDIDIEITHKSGNNNTERGRATRGLLVTDHVILNHDQVTWTTPELGTSFLTTTPYQREKVSALDRFSVHHSPTRRFFSGTGLELVTRQATIRYLYYSASCLYEAGLLAYYDLPVSDW